MHSRPIHVSPPRTLVDAGAKAPAGARMQRLRDATRLVHARIEGAMPVLDPSLTRARYTQVVEAFYGFYAPLEPTISNALGADAAALELARRAKLPLIAKDLRALGRTLAEIEALPRCYNLPCIDNASHAIGALYVIEGATLGGQIIRRHLRESLAIDADSGAALFTGYGPTTGAMWARFGEHVDRSSTIATEEAILAAIATFETLTTWLELSLQAP